MRHKKEPGWPCLIWSNSKPACVMTARWLKRRNMVYFSRSFRLGAHLLLPWGHSTAAVKITLEIITQPRGDQGSHVETSALTRGWKITHMVLRTETKWQINGTLHFITWFASKPQLDFRTRYYYHQIWVTDWGQSIGLIVVLKKRTGFSANPSRGRRKKITTQMGQVPSGKRS